MRTCILLITLLMVGCATSEPGPEFQLAFPNNPEALPNAVCAPRTMVIDRLGKKYSETVLSFGLASNGRAVELLTSEDGGFSIFMTHPNGVSCMLAAGKSWENVR